MRYIAFVLFFLGVGQAWGFQSCPVTTGTLTLNVTQPRTSAISPALFVFDATTSTSTATLRGAGNAIQDVYYTWDFGDLGVSGNSGSGKWSNGANGQPLKNKATGPVAAHLYVLPINGTTDLATTVQVWAYDGTSIATCTVSVTVLAPSGVNGFPGANTICAFNATLGTGCPAGAGTATSSTASGALAGLANGKRVLLKCGDTFTGGYTIAAGLTTASIGAYGSCVGTVSGNAAGRPIISSTGSGLTLSNGGNNTGNQLDVRVADIEVAGNNAAGGNLLSSFGANKLRQIIFYNFYGHDFQNGFFIQPNQSGLIASYITHIPGAAGSFGYQALYWNLAGQNSTTGRTCWPSPSNAAFCDVTYNAIIGNHVDMAGTADTTGVGSETFRMGACQLCVVSNNTLTDANNNGATLKFVCGNSAGGSVVCSYNEISDNLFSGKSGAFMVAIAATNSSTDERFQYTIFERNFIQGGIAGGTTTGARKVLVDGQNTTIRNNVDFLASTCDSAGSKCSDYGFQVSQSGTNPAPQNAELYNNTCYNQFTAGGCIGFIGGDGTNAPGINSFAANNLFYNNGAAGTTVTNNGTGNTVSNNTTNAALNPGMKNGSGNFSLFLDFSPTANATGATSAVPNYFDGFLLSWTGAYQLGALSPAAP